VSSVFIVSGFIRVHVNGEADVVAFKLANLGEGNGEGETVAVYTILVLFILGYPVWVFSALYWIQGRQTAHRKHCSSFLFATFMTACFTLINLCVLMCELPISGLKRAILMVKSSVPISDHPLPRLVNRSSSLERSARSACTSMSPACVLIWGLQQKTASVDCTPTSDCRFRLTLTATHTLRPYIHIALMLSLGPCL